MIFMVDSYNKYSDDGENEKVKAYITINKRHKKWVKEHKVNLSKFVRYKLEEVIKEDKLHPRFIRRESTDKLVINIDD